MMPTEHRRAEAHRELEKQIEWQEGVRDSDRKIICQEAIVKSLEVNEI